MSRPRTTRSATTDLGAVLADDKSRLASVENVAHRHPGYISGIVRCTSTTRPPQEDGLVIYETDTDRFWFSNGTIWVLWGGVFAYTSAQRTALTTMTDGTTVWETDTDRLWTYTGAAWVRVYPPNPLVTTGIGCRQYASTGRAIANNSLVATCPFNLAADTVYDTDNFHNPAVNPSRITVPTGLQGYYQISCGATYAANAAGLRVITLSINGTAVASSSMTNIGALFGTTLSCSTSYYLQAGWYIEMFCYQTSGAALNVGPGLPTYLEMIWQGS